MVLQNTEQIFQNNERTISNVNNFVLPNDFILNCDTSLSEVNLTLLEIPNGFNREYTLHIIDSSNNASVNNITINAPAGYFINGKSSAIINTNSGSAVLKFLNSSNYTLENEDYNRNKTIFVDVNYGNNTTAQKDRPLRPYKTIAQALNVAVAGDLVYVRAGDYQETILFKNEVDIFFEPKCRLFNPTSNSRIFDQLDGSADITCKILGYAELDSGVTFPNFMFNSCIRFRGNILDIYFECQSSTSNRGFCTLGTRDSSKFEIFIRQGHIENPNAPNYIERTTNVFSNQFPFTPAKLNFKMSWGKTTYVSQILWAFGADVICDAEFKGDVILNQNASLCGITQKNSTCIYTGNVVSNEPNTFDVYLFNTNGGIIRQSQGTTIVNAPSIKSKYQPIFKSIFSDGRTYYKGQEATTEFAVPILCTNGANAEGKFIVEGVRFIDYNQLRSEMIFWGNSNGDFTTQNVYLFNCFLIKDPNYAGVGGMLSKNLQGGDSRFFGFSSIFICAPNQTLTETDNVAFGDFYFDACSTNKDLGINTTNVGGTLITNNAYLDVINPI